MGITESDFWNMTLAELERALDSKRRVIKQQYQDRAFFDYKLADLIGRSVGRNYHSSTKMPEIYDFYPSIFDKEEIERQRAEQLAELSALRFKLFTNSYNKRFNQEV